MLGGGAAISLFPLMNAFSTRRTRPNIILIMADDLGYEALGCNGSTSYRTPHLTEMELSLRMPVSTSTACGR